MKHILVFRILLLHREIITTQEVSGCSKNSRLPCYYLCRRDAKYLRLSDVKYSCRREGELFLNLPS